MDKMSDHSAMPERAVDRRDLKENVLEGIRNRNRNKGKAA